MMSEERFFSEVKAAVYNYSPEVPASVYSGMRRKLWISQFTRFSIARLNMWYLLLAVSIAGSVFFYYGDSSTAMRPHSFEVNQTPFMACSGNASDGSAAEASSCTSGATSCCMAKADASANSTASANTAAAATQPNDPTQVIHPVANTADGGVQADAGNAVDTNEKAAASDEPAKRSERGLKVKTPGKK